MNAVSMFSGRDPIPGGAVEIPDDPDRFREYVLGVRQANPEHDLLYSARRVTTIPY